MARKGVESSASHGRQGLSKRSRAAAIRWCVLSTRKPFRHEVTGRKSDDKNEGLSPGKPNAALPADRGGRHDRSRNRMAPRHKHTHSRVRGRHSANAGHKEKADKEKKGRLVPLFQQ